MNSRVLELAARVYVFVFLNHYGVGKIIGGQFYRRGRLPVDVASIPLAEASAFDLAWTFMGYSFTYILFIGLVEVLGAWLLLWDRTKLLGVAILLPVMLNILVFDLVFLDAYGALASATIYTLLLLLILYLNRDTVRRAVRALTSTQRRTSSTARWKTAVLVIAILAVLFVVDQSLVHLFGHGRG